MASLKTKDNWWSPDADGDVTADCDGDRDDGDGVYGCGDGGDGYIDVVRTVMLMMIMQLVLTMV